MFSFFRTDKYDFHHNNDGLSINPGYWGEKLQSISTYGGYKEFDKEYFRSRVKEHFDMWTEDSEEEYKARLWEAIESEVLYYSSDEYEAYSKVHEFSYIQSNYPDFHFQDFFDGGGTERMTFHFIWCLYAIAWGVEQYDKHKASKAA